MFRLFWCRECVGAGGWLRKGALLWGLLAVALAGCPDPGSGEACLTSNDCILKGEICRGNICLKQDSCEQDGDCKYKGEVCREKLCVPDDGSGDGGNPPPTGCATTCSSDNECSKCDNNRNSCISGKCVKSERATAYARCGDDVGVACQDNMVCTGGTQKFCLPECDPSQKRCSDGKSGCFDPNGTGRGLCIPDGEATDGQPCSPNFTGDTTIDTKKFCKEGLFCDSSNNCKKIQEVDKYQACDAGRTCKDGMSCVVLSQNATSGYCLPSCDPQQADCDGGSGRCVQAASGKGICLPKGTIKELTTCAPPTGDAITGAQFCEAGLACVTLSAQGAICLKTVQQCSDTACAQGQICLTGSAGGVCVVPCQAGGSNCPNGLHCFEIQAGGQAVNICGP